MNSVISNKKAHLMSERAFYVILTVVSLAAVLAVSYIFSLSFRWSYTVSSSMYPTMDFGSNFLTYKISERTSISHGDIVVFSPYTADNASFLFGDDTEDYVKRVIGLPGDTISIHDGVLYLNSEPQAETYIAGPHNLDFDEVTVPENNYFLMGDNRNYSYDSRYIGFIPRENLEYKHLFHMPTLSGLYITSQFER